MAKKSKEKSKTTLKKRVQTTAKKSSSITTTAHNGPRRLKQPAAVWYKPKTWSYRQKPVHKDLPKASKLLRASFERLRSAQRTVIGITAIYGIGVVLLVRGFSASQDFTTLKSLLDSVLTGATGKVQSIALQLTLLFGGSSSTQTPNGGIYQTILFVICSLALIWALRQSQAKQPVSVKMSFYRGMYPLVPFVLLLAIIGLQTMPIGIGSYVYSTLVGGSIAVHVWEKVFAFIIFLVLAFWSLRMVTASIFAFYIVTLPDMTPLQALRSAKQLVTGRRLLVWRKLLLLPFAIIIGTSLAILPFLLFLTPVVVWVFFLLSTVWFALVHSYLYTLYRELIDD